MEQETTPKYLFVTRVHENKVRAYKFLSALTYGKYLYEDIESGFKECFLCTDVFSNTMLVNGYSTPTYKAQKRNEVVRKRRRRKKGIRYERRFK